MFSMLITVASNLKNITEDTFSEDYYQGRELCLSFLESLTELFARVISVSYQKVVG